MTRKEYIEKYALAAYLATLGTGYFPETALVQGAIESGNGASSLSAKYNNFYGIKSAGTWKGRNVNLVTGEVINGRRITVTAGFRVYNNFYGSTRDLVKFIKTYSRYKAVLAAQNPISQMYALGNSGYATAPGYGSTLVSTYSSYKSTIDKAIMRAKLTLLAGGLGVGIGTYFLIRSGLPQKVVSELKRLR